MAPQIWTNQPNVSSSVGPAVAPPKTLPGPARAAVPQTGFAIPPASQATWVDQATGGSPARQTGFTPAANLSTVQPTRLGR